jgi:hypothetical protein
MRAIMAYYRLWYILWRCYDNGILKISIPKKEEAKPEPSRMIEIQ